MFDLFIVKTISNISFLIVVVVINVTIVKRYAQNTLWGFYKFFFRSYKLYKITLQCDALTLLQTKEMRVKYTVHFY